LTGTPAPKAPTDAYALVRLACPEAFVGSFTLWKDMTMRKVNDFKWVPKEGSKEFIYKYMKPAIRFRKEDCLDLPPLTYVNRMCELSEQQTKAFSLMKKQLIMEQHTGEKITAANSAVKLLKLLQICCGVIRDNTGELYNLDCSKRLQVLEEIIEEADGKVIVFIPYIGPMDMVESYLKKKGYSTGLVNGSVGASARTKIFNDFQNGSTQLLIAHPKTASHGLNLTASSTIVWYAPIFSVENYIQANQRVNRPGQKNAMTVVHMTSSPLEAGIYRGLWGNIRMQDAILQQYNELVK